MDEGPIRGSDVFLAVLAYVPVLFLVPLLVRRKRRFLLYHARQGLYLFTVFLVLFVVFAGLFYLLVQRDLFNVGVLRVALADLVLLTFVAYVVVDAWMIVSVLLKKMVMLPVLGELAGER